jgi:ABC-2 type transport system permease protein
LFRVIIPWMIGKAFERVGDEKFMQLVAAKLEQKKDIPGPVLKELDPVLVQLLDNTFKDPKFDDALKAEFKGLAPVIKPNAPTFKKVIERLFKDEEFTARAGKGIPFGRVLQPSVQREVGPAVQDGVAETFSNYDFRAKTWAGLTKSDSQGVRAGAVSKYEAEGGLPKRGAIRFQVLVPAYAVTFAFFLVLTVGWLFVAERTHGTLVRLRAAPLSRGHVLLGKLLPCLAVSLVQGVFLLLAGRVVFGMAWGPEPWLLLPVVACTSVAAVGLAMLVASVAKTETQVAVYGTLLVLVLGGVSGSLMPRDLMPEEMRQASLFTPHAWALDAYSQLLANPDPQVEIVWTACAALAAFGAGFLLLAWWRLSLD